MKCKEQVIKNIVGQQWENCRKSLKRVGIKFKNVFYEK